MNQFEAHVYDKLLELTDRVILTNILKGEFDVSQRGDLHVGDEFLFTRGRQYAKTGRLDLADVVVSLRAAKHV